MNKLETLYLNELSRGLHKCIEELTGCPLQVVENTDEWALVLGKVHFIKRGYNKKAIGSLDERQSKYMTYVSLFEKVLELLKTPQAFKEWKQQEKIKKN